jgi:predicted nucleotidyltransferase
MVDMHSIQEVTQRIVQEFHPERVILFGSYAYGTPTADSDVDLLVILPYDGKGPRKALEILNKVNPKFPADILVRTPEQVQQRLAWNDFFLRDILEKGKVLYAATHP